ncbi:MAG: hypothetical protein Q9195_007344 [Heterodermia aff. obscurata]
MPTRTSPSPSLLHSPEILIPLILGGVLLTVLFILAFRHWLWQDDQNTMHDIEAASQIGAVDVEACRGALGPTGRVMSSAGEVMGKIEEERAEEMFVSGGDGGEEKGNGEELARITTWGSTMSWVRKVYSQKRKEEVEG